VHMFAYYPPLVHMSAYSESGSRPSGSEVVCLDMRVVMSYKYQGLGGGRFQGVADLEKYLYAKHVQVACKACECLKLIGFRISRPA